MIEKIDRILSDINNDILNYNGNNLFEDGLLDSLQMVELVSSIEDEFNIEIDAKYVIEDNFKTKESIISLISNLL